MSKPLQARKALKEVRKGLTELASFGQVRFDPTLAGRVAIIQTHVSNVDGLLREMAKGDEELPPIEQADCSEMEKEYEELKRLVEEALQEKSAKAMKRVLLQEEE